MSDPVLSGVFFRAEPVCVGDWAVLRAVGADGTGRELRESFSLPWGLTPLYS